MAFTLDRENQFFAKRFQMVCTSLFEATGCRFDVPLDSSKCKRPVHNGCTTVCDTTAVRLDTELQLSQQSLNSCSRSRKSVAWSNFCDAITTRYNCLRLLATKDCNVHRRSCTTFFLQLKSTLAIIVNHEARAVASSRTILATLYNTLRPL